MPQCGLQNIKNDQSLKAATNNECIMQQTWMQLQKYVFIKQYVFSTQSRNVGQHQWSKKHAQVRRLAKTD